MHPKHRIIYILLIVLAICAVLFFFRKNYTYAPTDDFQQENNNQSTEPERVTINESTNSYEIKIQYPKLVDENINNDFKNLVDESVLVFKDLATEFPIVTSEKYSFNVDYPRIISSKGYTTYIFSIYMYTGGAHGNTDIKTLTYNSSGKLILLKDLFLLRDYLKEISSLSKKILVEKLGDNSPEYMINDGTLPTEENFSRFAIADGGIIFIFPQYQVAPYVLGPQEIIIPYSSFNKINL
jgi:peptidoglycan-N-acetylglucosamine deacetylase